jgi:hypothetical protein
MRLKLVLLMSLLAAVLGAGASIGIIVGTLGSWIHPFASPGYGSNRWIPPALYLPPLVTALLASSFVYRHTARRRKLQAAVTGILTLLLCLFAFALFALRYL